MFFERIAIKLFVSFLVRCEMIDFNKKTPVLEQVLRSKFLKAADQANQKMPADGVGEGSKVILICLILLERGGQ